MRWFLSVVAQLALHCEAGIVLGARARVGFTPTPIVIASIARVAIPLTPLNEILSRLLLAEHSMLK